MTMAISPFNDGKKDEPWEKGDACWVIIPPFEQRELSGMADYSEQGCSPGRVIREVGFQRVRVKWFEDDQEFVASIPKDRVDIRDPFKFPSSRV